MPECIMCPDEYPRDQMLSIDSWADPPEDPDLVCLRCALVALRGGPEALSAEDREDLRVSGDGEVLPRG